MSSEQQMIVFLTHTIDTLNQLVESMKATQEASMNEMALLREEIAYLKRKLYGRSSEKTVSTVDEVGGQLSLFDMEDVEGTEQSESPQEKEEEVITYTRKKSKGRRQQVLNQLPSEDVHHILEGDACVCETCRNQLSEIGTSCHHREVVYVPATLKCVNHIQHAYKCSHCSQHQMHDVIVKAPVPQAPIDHSFGSPSVIAHTIHQKFNQKVPNYRQEADWNKMGLPITRKEITNWQLLVSERYLKFLYERLGKQLVEHPILHADETPFRVLDSETENTYYWVFLSGNESPQGITYYHHDQSRGGH
ncbi:transposase [Aerococcaceae bacterium zg-ZJ1578]|uniref:transposase n=1 Tax=Aerococcaceae bacterium zg-252 TaxID=2796928 RepID=UPI001A2E8D2F|nr:transposase [Aerococcaceae bacterium zg-1578]